MRVSLKALLVFVTILGLALCFITYETPISRLQKKGASFGKKTTGSLLLMGFPNDWDNFISAGQENEDIEVVSFRAHAKLAEIDFRSLGNFPNLEALSIKSKIYPEWLSHLKHCEKLSVLSSSSSHANDESVDQLIDLESLKMINVPGPDVSLDAKKRFRDSGSDRIAYP